MTPALRPHYSPANESGAPPIPSGPLGRVYCFFAHDAWRPENVRARGLRGALLRTCRIAYLATRRFFRDECFYRARALTYITVLSLVPLLAFSFSMAKGFGLYSRLVEGTIKPLLDRTFGSPAAPLAADAPLVVPEGGSREIRLAADRVLDFVEETDVSSLGTLGLVVLLYAVIVLLGTVEGSFNQIWGVHKARSPLRKLTDYLAMVIITPIFLITATGITTAAQSSGVVEFLREGLHLGPLINVLLRLAPLFALWAGFTFLYLAMPNTRTRLTSALIGALVGGTLWQITLVLHIQFQVGIARYNAIYSSFAAIPIFLVWVNISWITVLLGAEVCFAHQSEPDYLKLGEARTSDHRLRERIALSVFARIGERFRKGEDPWTAEQLVADLGIPLRPVDEVLNTLVARKLLAEVERGSKPGYLPARDLETITVKMVLDALKGSGQPPSAPETNPVDEHIERLLGGLDHEAEESRHNRSIASLVDAAVLAPAPAPERAAAPKSLAPNPR